MKRWQWLLSFLILFHLLCVLVIPNPYSYFQQAWRSWLWPYANTLNIAFTWQFFSPDPAAAISYEYVAIKSDEIQFSVNYPDEENRPWFRPNYSRRNTLKNVLMKFPNLNESIFVEYFCRQYPDVEIFDVNKKVVVPTTLEAAYIGRALLDKSEVFSENVGMYGCDY